MFAGRHVLRYMPTVREVYFQALCQRPFVVFDGYPGGPSTEDIVHRKWSVTYVGATV